MVYSISIFSTRKVTTELFTIALLLLGTSSMLAPAAAVLTSALTRANLFEGFGGRLLVGPKRLWEWDG